MESGHHLYLSFSPLDLLIAFSLWNKPYEQILPKQCYKHSIIAECIS